MTSIECSGLESSIFNCTGGLRTTQSCSPFGVASVVCHGKTVHGMLTIVVLMNSIIIEHVLSTHGWGPLLRCKRGGQVLNA